MFKVVKSRKANKIAYLLVLVTMILSYLTLIFGG